MLHTFDTCSLFFPLLSSALHRATPLPRSHDMQEKTARSPVGRGVLDAVARSPPASASFSPRSLRKRWSGGEKIVVVFSGDFLQSSTTRAGPMFLSRLVRRHKLLTSCNTPSLLLPARKEKRAESSGRSRPPSLRSPTDSSLLVRGVPCSCSWILLLCSERGLKKGQKQSECRD